MSEIKQTPAHDNYNDSVYQLICDVNPKSVIEVGCMRGSLANAYKKINPSCNWTGIDIDGENIFSAKNICNTAILGDIEKIDFADIANIKDVDCWVLGDVLEHLRDPWAILEKIKMNSQPNVQIIACIPNSQHWSFQVRVNAGMFDYEDQGLFDRTHIRFFSRDTIVKMFFQSGLYINSINSRDFNFPGYEKYIHLIKAMAAITGIDPDQAEKDALAYQFVIHASSRC